MGTLCSTSQALPKEMPKRPYGSGKKWRLRAETCFRVLGLGFGGLGFRVPTVGVSSGVLVVWITSFWGLYWDPLFMEITISVWMNLRVVPFLGRSVRLRGSSGLFGELIFGSATHLGIFVDQALEDSGIGGQGLGLGQSPPTTGPKYGVNRPSTILNPKH